MSHQPERKERNCLNCGTEVQGRFCHVCGQENIVTQQGFWPMAKHFIYDVLHFDGKFFHTLLYIFTKPGFVARQYVAGKRMSYLDPIRMYLFTSAVFFLVFFSFNSLKINPTKPSEKLSNRDKTELAVSYKKKLKKRPGDLWLMHNIAVLQDTTKVFNNDSLEHGNIFTFGDRAYTSLRDYDSVQATLPQGEKDGWLWKRLTRQSIRVNEKYGKSEESVNIFLETFLHKLPYLLFLSLPFFASILKLLYVRRKSFYYSDHAVFTLYHYIFTFILLLIVFGVGALRDWTGWGLLDFLFSILLFALPVYLYIEMKKFYGQGWGKTLVKYLLLNIGASTVLIVLLLFFLLFSVFQL